MTVKCCIGSLALKCWGRVIHTLVAAAESDIHFRFTANSLTLSTFDSALSICCTCKFDRSFFTSYTILEGTQFCLKIPSKCLLKPFKSLKFLLKHSDSCLMELEPESNTLIVAIPCKGGIQVRYKLNFSLEANALEVEYDDELLQNCITGSPKLILKSLANFPTKGVADLTLHAGTEKLLLKNCVNDTLKKEGKVYTQLVLNAVDFSEYKIILETDVTFPMREFKAFVQFAEYMKTSLSLRFHGPDEPVCVKADTEDGLYTATLMMATKTLGHEKARSNKTTTSVRASTTAQERRTTSNALDHQPNLNDTSDFDDNISDAHRRSLSRASSVTNGNIIDNTSVHQSVIIGANNSVDNHSNDLIMEDILPNDDDRNSHSLSMLGSNYSKQNNDIGTQRMRTLFPNLGRNFDPVKDLPGYNDVLVECSDEED